MRMIILDSISHQVFSNKIKSYNPSDSNGRSSRTEFPNGKNARAYFTVKIDIIFRYFTWPS
jgi:hypothetical protein